MDNAATLDVICGKARRVKHTSLQQPLPSSPCCIFSVFAILDDECNIPKGSDDNIAPAISQLATRLATGPNWSKDKPLLSVSKIGHDKFSVAHYAGDVRWLLPYMF